MSRHCDACEVSFVTCNGVTAKCHETGCPDAWRDYPATCRDCGCDFTPETRPTRWSRCPDCLNPQPDEASDE